MFKIDFQRNYIQPDSRFSAIEVDVSTTHIEHMDEKVEILFDALEATPETTPSVLYQEEKRGQSPSTSVQFAPKMARFWH